MKTEKNLTYIMIYNIYIIYYFVIYHYTSYINDIKNMYIVYNSGFPGGSDSKASACNMGDPSSIPGLGRSPGEGNGNPFQYSCLENPMDR